MGKKRGRPTIGAKPMKKVLVSLDQESIDWAKKKGCGNLSRGIRKAIACAKNQKR